MYRFVFIFMKKYLKNYRFNIKGVGCNIDRAVCTLRILRNNRLFCEITARQFKYPWL